MFCLNLDVDMINVFNFNLCCFIVDTSHQQTGPMPPTATLMQPQVAGTMHGTVPPQQQSGNNSFSTHVFLASLCNCICFFLLVTPLSRYIFSKTGFFLFMIVNMHNNANIFLLYNLCYFGYYTKQNHCSFFYVVCTCFLFLLAF